MAIIINNKWYSFECYAASEMYLAYSNVEGLDEVWLEDKYNDLKDCEDKVKAGLEYFRMDAEARRELLANHKTLTHTHFECLRDLANTLL